MRLPVAVAPKAISVPSFEIEGSVAKRLPMMLTRSISAPSAVVVKTLR